MLLSSVVGRAVFYNNSLWDGNNTAANSSDDAAIATDKSALLPGQTAAYSNITNFRLGINGVMVDISGLPSGTGPTASNFVLKVGTTADGPSAWSSAPAPASVTTRRGAGVAGSDRVTLTFADSSILKKWLYVRVMSDAVTGLTSPDVFYFGTLGGEQGDDPAAFAVTSADTSLITNHLNPNPTEPVTSTYDVDKDRKVNALDSAYVQSQVNAGATLVKLTATPAAPSGAAASAVGPNTTRVSWADNSGVETQYRIDQSTTSNFASYTTYYAGADATSIDVTVTSHAVPGANNPYYYRVYAASGSSTSSYSATASENLVFVHTDNVESTSERAALESNIAGAAPYSVIVLDPGGTYHLDQRVDVNNPVHIEGRVDGSGNKSKLVLRDANGWPYNRLLRYETLLPTTPDTWTETIGANTTTFNVGTTIAGHYAINDKIFIELGDDPYDNEPWEADDITAPTEEDDREWIEHFSAFATVTGVNTTTGTLTIDSASAPPYAINNGTGSQARPHRIRKINGNTTMVKDVWLNNIAGDYKAGTANPDGGILLIRVQNVLVQNLSGTFSTVVSTVDTDDVTVRNVNANILVPAGFTSHGRILSGWQNDRTRLENATVTTSEPMCVVFRESWDRDMTITSLTVNWNSTYNSTGDATVFLLTGGTSGARIDNVTVNNVGRVHFIDDGSASVKYSSWSFGNITVTGPLWAVPLPGTNSEGNSVERLTVGSGVNARTYDASTVTTGSTTFNLSSNMNGTLDIPNGLYRKVSFRLSNTNGTPLTSSNVSMLHFANDITYWDIDAVSGFYSSQTLSWEMTYGDVMPMNNNLNKFLYIMTGSVPAGTQLTVTYEYW